jgi:hypothetical protein
MLNNQQTFNNIYTHPFVWGVFKKSRNVSSIKSRTKLTLFGASHGLEKLTRQPSMWYQVIVFTQKWTCCINSLRIQKDICILTSHVLKKMNRDSMFFQLHCRVCIVEKNCLTCRHIVEKNLVKRYSYDTPLTPDNLPNGHRLTTCNKVNCRRDGD